jgi:hypothetical protein
MAGRVSDSLEERVREGASGFEFDALLSGTTDSTWLDQEQLPGDYTQPTLPNLTQTAAARIGTAYGDSVSSLSRLAWSRSSVFTALLGGLALGGWALYLRQPAVEPVRALAVSNPAPQTTRTTTQPSAEKRKLGLPWPELTPGERLAQAVEPTPIPADVGTQVFKSYGVDPNDGKYRAVRLIPSELGGTNGIGNVFPLTPWFAELKSRLDSYLVRQVAAGNVSIGEAVEQLTSNWISACHRHYIRNYGEQDRDKARSTEDRLRWE